MLFGSIAPRPFVRAPLKHQQCTRPCGLNNYPWRTPTLSVQRVRIVRPVSLQMHCTRAKVEATVCNAVGVGNHGKARQSEWVSAGTARRRPEDGPITPIEFKYRATARRIQGQLRVLMPKHEMATVGFH